MDKIKERIAKLEAFQNKWKFYFWALVVVAGLFSIFFGFKISQTKANLQNISETYNQLENKLKSLNNKAKESESIADRAYRIAGDLEFAINEAKKSSLKAESKSAEITSMYKEILKQIDDIKVLTKEATATAKVVESRFRQAEILLSELKSAQNDPQNKSSQFLTVKLDGISMNIRFIEGPNPFENIEINQSGYRGNVFVPKGSSAKIVGSTSGSNFIVSQELKGRVIDNTEGISNTWAQDTEKKQHTFSSGLP